jgi:hypothetical protein
MNGQINMLRTKKLSIVSRKGTREILLIDF